MIFRLVAQCLRALFIGGSFKKPLSLSLSTNVLPILFVFPAHPDPDLTPGMLRRYAESRPRSYKQKSGALLGSLVSSFTFINSLLSLHPYQSDPVVFCQFHQGLVAVPDTYGIYLETFRVLDGCLSERIWMLLHVQPFSVFSITHSVMAYVLAWNAVVWIPRLKLCPLLEPHFYTPLPVLLVSDPSVYQTMPAVTSALNLTCHLHLSRNLTVNGLWNACLGNHPVSPCMYDGFMLLVPRLSSTAVICGCRLSVLAARYQFIDTSWPFTSFIKRRGLSHQTLDRYCKCSLPHAFPFTVI